MFSSMSAAASCLNQRESYTYMFHDPLALGNPYAAHTRNACASAVSHQQTGQHPVYGNTVSGATNNSGNTVDDTHLFPFDYYIMYYIIDLMLNSVEQLINRLLVSCRLECRCRCKSLHRIPLN